MRTMAEDRRNHRSSVERMVGRHRLVNPHRGKNNLKGRWSCGQRSNDRLVTAKHHDGRRRCGWEVLLLRSCRRGFASTTSKRSLSGMSARCLQGLVCTIFGALMPCRIMFMIAMMTRTSFPCRSSCVPAALSWRRLCRLLCESSDSSRRNSTTKPVATVTGSRLNWGPQIDDDKRWQGPCTESYRAIP